MSRFAWLSCLCLCLLSRLGSAAPVLATVHANAGTCSSGLVPSCQFTLPGGSLATGFMGDVFSITVLFPENQTLHLGLSPIALTFGTVSKSGAIDAAFFGFGATIALTNAAGDPTSSFVTASPFQADLCSSSSCGWGGASEASWGGATAQGVLFRVTTSGNPAQAASIGLGTFSFQSRDPAPFITPEPSETSLVAAGAAVASLLVRRRAGRRY